MRAFLRREKIRGAANRFLDGRDFVRRGVKPELAVNVEHIVFVVNMLKKRLRDNSVRFPRVLPDNQFIQQNAERVDVRRAVSVFNPFESDRRVFIGERAGEIAGFAEINAL